MKLASYKNKILIFILILSTPYFSFAQENNIICSKKGYTILTINGILTDINGATENRDALMDHLNNVYKNEPLRVDFLYNPTHGKFIDLLDALNQKNFDQNSFYVEDSDFAQMLKDASEKVNTQKLLLVGHSQGNFYTNTFYNKVAGEEGGVPGQSIGVYAVATPASHVAGDGLYVTSDTDTIINDFASKAPLTNTLKPNIHIELKGEDQNSNGHSFSQIYLPYQGERIISDIKKSLDKLGNNDIQDESKPCIDTPKFTFTQQVQKLSLNTIDFSVNLFNKVIYEGGQRYLALINNAGKGLVKLMANAIDAVVGLDIDSLSQDYIPPTEVPENNVVVKKYFIEDTPPIIVHLNDEIDNNVLLDTQLVKLDTPVPLANISDVVVVDVFDGKDVLPGGGGFVAANLSNTPTDSNSNQNNNNSGNPPDNNPPSGNPPPDNPPAHSYLYTYANKYTFGIDNGDGRNWQVWSFNGSNVYDWVDSYVNNYLREEFKLQTYPGGFYCSRCLEHAAFTSDPRLGFDGLNTIFVNGIEGGIQGSGNGLTYNYVLQWDAGGYTIAISHDSIQDYNAYIDVANIDSNTWVGWDVALNNFQPTVETEGHFQGVPYLSPDGRTGGSDMVLKPYPVYISS